MTLEDYIKKQYPSQIEEFKRYSTPYYYEPGVIYRTLTNGFGEGRPGISQFMIKNAFYSDTDMQLTLTKIGHPEDSYGVSMSEAYLKLKREVEEEPKGIPIPNNKSDFNIVVNNKHYRIHQAYWRNYDTKRLGGRLWIHCDEDLPSNRHQPYYELYCYFGSKWHLKHVHSYDSVYREQYDIKFNISVREFKQTVFGDPNIKFIHEPVQELSDKVERAIRASRMPLSL